VVREQAAVQVPVLEPLPAEAAAQDDLTGAGADAGAGSERQPTGTPVLGRLFCLRIRALLPHL
jgi:hypothetical protein